MFIGGLTMYIMALAANSLIFLARIFSPLKPLFSRSNLIGSKVTFWFLKRWVSIKWLKRASLTSLMYVEFILSNFFISNLEGALPTASISNKDIACFLVMISSFS